MALLFNPRLLRPLFWVLLAAAVILALDPRPPHLPIDRLGDKFAHMLAFAVLTGLANVAWPQRGWLGIALAMAAIGAGIEVLQAIPALHRDSDWRDFVADLSAILVATGAARLLLRFAPRPAFD